LDRPQQNVHCNLSNNIRRQCDLVTLFAAFLSSLPNVAQLRRVTTVQEFG
jgi:hypothetical protein